MNEQFVRMIDWEYCRYKAKFAQVVLNINQAFHCEDVLNRLPTVTEWVNDDENIDGMIIDFSSTEKRELWEQLRVECKRFHLISTTCVKMDGGGVIVNWHHLPYRQSQI